MVSGCWFCQLPPGGRVRRVLCGSRKHEGAKVEWTEPAQCPFPFLLALAFHVSIGKQTSCSQPMTPSLHPELARQARLSDSGWL